MADPDEDEVALSHLGIVNSAPFDWGGDTPQDVATTPSSGKTGRLLVDQMPSNNTSGLDSLKKILNSNDVNSSGHQKSKDLLRKLLGDHNISISPESAVSQSAATAGNSESRYNQVLEGDIASRDVSIRGLSDRAVAELTCEGKTSIIASILRLFDMDRESSSVSYDKKKLWPPPQPIQNDPMIMDAPRLSTAEIVRSVHLTASPGDIPAGMDSKEYTLAILHFLSSHVPFLSENESNYRKKDDDNNSYSSSSEEGWEMLRRTLPVLPLIKATNPEQSLENCVYGRVRPLVKLGQSERKQYPDSVDKDIGFRRKVLNLERIFNSSLPFPMKEFEPFVFQKYMPRRKLVPRIEGIAKEELTLMISGHIPGVKAAKAAAASSTPTQSSTTSSPAASSDANTPQSGEKSTPQSDVKPSSEELNSYMDKWVAKNAPINLMPSLKQKETIIEETGVDKKRLESWFYRARKKLKRTQETENPVPVSAGLLANSSAGASTIPSHTTKPDE